MIDKLKTFEIKNASQILGGDMHRETYINRRKSADKTHNKTS